MFSDPVQGPFELEIDSVCKLLGKQCSEYTPAQHNVLLVCLGPWTLLSSGQEQEAPDPLQHQ